MQTQHHGRVDVAALGQQSPRPLPSRHRAARHVSRADGQVGAVLDRMDQRGQHRRIVLQVGVHLDQDLEAVRQAPAEPGAVGRPQTGLLGPAQHGHAAVLGPPLLGQIGGAVRTAVVHHQHLGLGHVVTHEIQHHQHVLGLVVGGQHHERLHGQ